MRVGRYGINIVLTVAALSTLLMSANRSTASEPIFGQYMEARTCQVYTGPCFANGESGIAGRNAVMAWSLQRGELNGVDLSGLHVAMVVKASATLGFRGLDDPETLETMVLIDEAASEVQRDALIEFARHNSGRAGENIVCVKTAPMAMSLDEYALTGRLSIEGYVELTTRPARKEDCICSNEAAYYPPLAELQGFVPGVTIEGEVRAYALGSRWSIPDTRTAYMGTFSSN